MSQAYHIITTAMKVYSSIYLLEAVKITTVWIIDNCELPQIKYPVKYKIFVV